MVNLEWVQGNLRYSQFNNLRGESNFVYDNQPVFNIKPLIFNNKIRLLNSLFLLK